MNRQDTVPKMLVKRLTIFLDKCVLLGWKGFNNWITYNDLFSVGSGIMEFVKRPSEGKMIMINAEIVEDNEGYPGVDAMDSADDIEPKYHYMMMSSMDKPNKIKYFLRNAILP